MSAATPAKSVKSRAARAKSSEAAQISPRAASLMVIKIGIGERRAQHRYDGERGLPVSRSRLLQDQLLEREIGDRLAQPGVLLLQILQSLDLVAQIDSTALHPCSQDRPSDRADDCACRCDG